MVVLYVLDYFVNIVNTNISILTLKSWLFQFGSQIPLHDSERDSASTLKLNLGLAFSQSVERGCN